MRSQRDIRSILLAVLAAVTITGVQAKPQRSCESLADLNNLQDTTIDSAVTAVTAGGNEFCRVLGHISPEPASHINFVVNLPSQWNHRFLLIGDGGFDGTVSMSEVGIDDGFATANSDSGHAAADFDGAAFAFDQPDLEAGRAREVDYGFRAARLTALIAKKIVKARYKKKAKFSYFNGCSTGGRQAHMLVQRDPTLFDGVVDGAAAFDLTGLAVEQNWSMQQTFATDIDGKQVLLADEVMAHCDGIDGLADGLIDDPRECDFDPASLLCGGGQDPAVDNCLSADQVATVQAIYDGPSNTSGFSYQGKPRGSESGWDLWIIPPGRFGTPLQGGFTFSFMNFLFFEVDPGPDFDWRDFDFETDPGERGFMAAILDATDPDISDFVGHSRNPRHRSGKRRGKGKGGKYILYHGWADGLIPPFRTVRYYEAVVAAQGGSFEKTQESVRLFMAPGMDHCGFPPTGLLVSDWLTPLMDWVEHGIAPDRIIATQTVGANRTRPLCPYPRVARYVGSGDVDDAENFACVLPEE